MILKNNVVQFKTSYAMLVQRDEQIRNNLKQLQQCKNRTFVQLTNQVKQKDVALEDLKLKYQNQKKKVKVLNKKLQQFNGKNKKLAQTNEDLLFKLNIQIQKNQNLKKELRQVQNSSSKAQKIQKEYISKLEQELFQLKLQTQNTNNKKNKAISLTKSNRSKYTNGGLDLSKVFEQETVHSFGHQSIITSSFK